LSVLLLQCLSFPCSADPRHLHSFPTRRSSDLSAPAAPAATTGPLSHAPSAAKPPGAHRHRREIRRGEVFIASPPLYRSSAAQRRSEEHTSELQSRFDLVCRLLLEKKKKK